MAGGLFQGLSKLLDAGATALQHKQFVERLRGMKLEDAKAQLTAYVRGMPDAGFNGLKLALALLARNTKDLGTSTLLKGLLESLDAARGAQTSAASAATATAVQHLVNSRPAQSFEDDLAMVGGTWHELDHDGRIAALTAHLATLTPDTFRTFRAHLSRMVDNVGDEIRQHEASEENAWGGFVEDRINYRLARLQTGQRDPAFLARLREFHDYRAFYEWVGKVSDLAWEERERQRLEARTSARPAPTAATPAPPPEATQEQKTEDERPETEDRRPATEGGTVQAGIAMLRTQLRDGLASGEIRAERRVSYERLLDKMEGLVAPLSDPNRTVDEKAKLLERFRGLMTEFGQSYVTPGAADRLDGLSDAARARALEDCIAEMKGFLYRELAQTPPKHTMERAGELMGDLVRAHQEVAQLAEDEAAIAFEREMLRVVATDLHDFAQREHLMVARPLWQCAGVTSSPHGLFFAGRDDLAETIGTLAAHLRLDLPSTRGQYYGQARWDALRSCHVGVFDLRGYRPDLAQSDPAAAAAIAATAYELGLACALGKPVVVVTRPDDTLPFDVDIAPCEIAGSTAKDAQLLGDALDRAWYSRQRTTGASGLSDTFAFLDRITQEHPRRRMLEATGLLDAQQIDDPIGFTGCVKQILREKGLDDLQAIFPAWPGRYPDAEAPTVFHVMPFSTSWSHDIRDAARATCVARGYSYRRGDEADEGRIIQAIWDDICAAHVVLVDLTGLNLNVLMELGMAHALGRTVLTVRQAGLKEPIPRNIEKLRVLDYDGAAGLTRVLESRLAARVAGV